MGLLSFKKKQSAAEEFVNEIREHSRLGFVKDRELEKLVLSNEKIAIRVLQTKQLHPNFIPQIARFFWTAGKHIDLSVMYAEYYVDKFVRSENEGAVELRQWLLSEKEKYPENICTIGLPTRVDPRNLTYLHPVHVLSRKMCEFGIHEPGGFWGIPKFLIQDIICIYGVENAQKFVDKFENVSLENQILVFGASCLGSYVRKKEKVFYYEYLRHWRAQNPDVFYKGINHIDEKRKNKLLVQLNG